MAMASDDTNRASIMSFVDLECPICYETYKDPVTLTCGHSLCRRCLNDLYFQQGKNGISCPECRSPIVLTHLSSIKKIGTNVRLREMIEKLKDNDPTLYQRPTKCPYCHQLRNMIICEHCGVMVCADCRDDHAISLCSETASEVNENIYKLSERMKKLDSKIFALKRNSRTKKELKDDLTIKIMYKEKLEKTNKNLSDLLCRLENFKCGGIDAAKELVEEFNGLKVTLKEDQEQYESLFASTESFAVEPVKKKDTRREGSKSQSLTPLQRELKDAKESYDRLKRFRRNINKPEIADALNKVAYCHFKLGDYKSALQYYEHCLKIEKKLFGNQQNNPNISASLNNIGLCHQTMDQNEMAFEYLKKSLEMKYAINGEKSNNEDIAITLGNIGKCIRCIGDVNKALSYHKRSLNMYKKLNGEDANTENIAISLGDIALCYDELGDFEKAIDFQKDSLAMYKSIHGGNANRPEIATSLYNIGLSYHHLKEYNTAVEYYNRSLDMMYAIFGKYFYHPGIKRINECIQLCEKLI